MDEFFVDTEQLQQMADTISERTKSMKEGAIELRTAMTKLNQGWDGEVHEEFVQSVEQDLKALEKLIANINMLHDFQNHAMQDYVSCENKVAEYILEP